MGEGFKKFQNRVRLGALIRSCLIGASFGALASGGLLLVMKIMGNSVFPLWYVLIGVGGALAVTAVCMLIQRKSDVKLAKMLDENLSLNEKVQTMVAFKDKSDAISVMQREDTESRLKSIPANKIKFSRVWQCVTACALCVALLVTATVIPTKTADGENNPPEGDYEMTKWQITALNDLIEYVENSQMADQPKQITVEQLNGLILDVEAGVKQSLMTERVIAVIQNVRVAVDTANSYPKLAVALKESEQTNVNNLGIVIEAVSGAQVITFFAELETAFISDATGAELKSFSQELDIRLINLPELSSDALFLALKSFTSELNKIKNSTTDYTSDQVKQKISASCTQAGLNLVTVLATQSANEQVYERVTETLMDIFGISEDQLPENLKPESEGEKGDASGGDDDDKEIGDGNDGGMGDREQIFGSDDTIYDPYENVNRPYGEVLNDYYAKIQAMIVDGVFDEEEEQIINDYFNALFNGAKKQD